jgi:hypothetical protein
MSRWQTDLWLTSNDADEVVDPFIDFETFWHGAEDE